MLICYDENGESAFLEICKAAFKILKLSGDAVLELVAASEAEIQKVNSEQRGIDKVTDVLSFPNLSDIKAFTKDNYPTDFDPDCGAVFLGSIVICKEQVKRQAEEYGHSLEREESYLFVHGLLHLLGFDHELEPDKQAMRAKEEEILSGI